MLVAEVQAALVEAFTLESLERMLRFRLNKRLDTIVTTPRDMNDATFQVATAAAREGWISDLVVAMKVTLPDNPIIGSLEEYGQLDRGKIGGDANGLSRKVFELEAAIFGLQGMDNTGVINELKRLNERVDQLVADMQAFAKEMRERDEVLRTMTATVPNSMYNDWAVRLLIALLSVTTIASLFLSATAHFGDRLPWLT